MPHTPGRAPSPASAASRADAERTREALLRTGARLISRYGLGVPVGRIQREADQRNKSAVAYHFGSVPGLAAAVLQRHRAQVEARRAAALAGVDDPPAATLRTLVGLLVRPAAAELRTAQGRDYLRLLPQVTHLAQIRSGAPETPAALTRTLELLRARLEGDGVPYPDERLALVAQMHAAALADRARRIDDHGEHRDARRPGRADVEVSPGHDRFVDLLTDMLTTALGG